MSFAAKDVTQMSEQNGQNGAKPQEAPQGITKITVGGYKSIAQEQSIEIRPLTILAGANSSGKSSIMQPLLLLKQTLEASYEPETLLLDGRNINVTSAEQILSKIGDERFGVFSIGIEINSDVILTTSYTGRGLRLDQMSLRDEDGLTTYRLNMPSDEIRHENEDLLRLYLHPSRLGSDVVFEYQVSHDRCFFQVDTIVKRDDGSVLTKFESMPAEDVEIHLLESIHLPGLRGGPVRVYPATAVGPVYPGVFDDYTASVVAHWRTSEDIDRLSLLQNQLFLLGLTGMVAADFVTDTQLVVKVGRTLQSDLTDMVSIADVGIGVSQTLPILVALLAAKPGQLVYLEQPEVHLHPRAQTAMAQVLADAAMRGVRVVAETHSSLLLLGVQTLVAEGKLPPELVKLHWFTRGDDGATTIRSADLDEGGAFGDWPEDFGDVSLDAQDRFLDAAERHLLKR